MSLAEQEINKPSSSRRTSRAIRFNLEKKMDVITRPFGMRFYTFWMSAENLSKTGFFLTAKSEAFIPYKVGNKIHVTMDMSGVLFDRPLHFILEVQRIVKVGNRQGFGCSIHEVIGDHDSLFAKGLKNLGDADKLE